MTSDDPTSRAAVEVTAEKPKALPWADAELASAAASAFHVECLRPFPSCRRRPGAPPSQLPERRQAPACVRACGEAAQDSSLSTPGLTKEKLLNKFWSMLLMSLRSVEDSRGRSLRNSLSKLLQSHGDFWARVWWGAGKKEGRGSATGPSLRLRLP